ncbi:hypothetical protein ELUMI_v1c05330 [Williamsoniiplasma luminosum]|uniref:Uncharacterized protein n=1 Tax=Williamsoniiplasma luminosum TaxID=214888 RepID=A0A2K8NU16_9MOLU|nr:hypothetical protein ELUMI_v1c05330 [Williamsoniiplasma luminosum]
MSKYYTLSKQKCAVCKTNKAQVIVVKAYSSKSQYICGECYEKGEQHFWKELNNVK